MDLVSADGHEPDVWHIQSTKGEQVYQVKLEQNNCQHNSLMRCRVCGICIHQYSCLCMDSLLQVTICKHIHFTMHYLSKSEDVNVNEVLTLKTLDLKPSHLQSIYLRDTNSSMGDDVLKGLNFPRYLNTSHRP